MIFLYIMIYLFIGFIQTALIDRFSKDHNILDDLDIFNSDRVDSTENNYYKSRILGIVIWPLVCTKVMLHFLYITFKFLYNFIAGK